MAQFWERNLLPNFYAHLGTSLCKTRLHRAICGHWCKSDLWVVIWLLPGSSHYSPLLPYCNSNEAMVSMPEHKEWANFSELTLAFKGFSSSNPQTLLSTWGCNHNKSLSPDFWCSCTGFQLIMRFGARFKPIPSSVKVNELLCLTHHVEDMFSSVLQQRFGKPNLRPKPSA